MENYQIVVGKSGLKTEGCPQRLKDGLILSHTVLSFSTGYQIGNFRHTANIKGSMSFPDVHSANSSSFG